MEVLGKRMNQELTYSYDKIEVITTPPVNKILRVLVYTPSFNEALPITTIENPSIPLAI